MNSQKRLSKEDALKKICNYCAYQERNHQEVKDKLYSYGLFSKDVNEIISKLIENNYLNEERYAKIFAGSKFRIKQWGRRKIAFTLKQKGISPYNIKLSLKEIDEDDYLQTLKQLAISKWNSLKGDPILSKMAKTTAYLLQKGYEPDIISKIVAGIRSPHSR